MQDHETFAGFKQKMIDDNEKQYAKRQRDRP